MDYQALLSTIQESHRCQLDQIEQVLTDLVNDDNEDSIEKSSALHAISNAIMSCDNCIGTADSYHNVAVAYAREDAEDIACRILEKGLESFPQSVDLLADYIKYMISCSDFSKALTRYEKLISIPKSRWNWRAFTFSIDFLFARLERENTSKECSETIISAIGELVKEYQNNRPFDEQSFLAEADMQRYFNEREKEIETLEKAISKLKAAPKCLMRYADIQYEKGEYEKALQAINRCKRDAVEPQLGVNYGYTFYLSALCKIAILFDEIRGLEEGVSNVQKEQVEGIYEDCKVASQILKSITYKKNIAMLVKVLEIKTKIDYLDD